MKNSNNTRRDFLRHSAALTAGAAVPSLWTSGAFAQNAGSKPTVAAIGVGGSRGRYNQGGAIARRAAKFADMIAVCDVDDLHCEEFNADFGGKLQQFRDYRKMLAEVKPDTVTIGTPDHWHVPIAIEALRAGCDVYCEKPLTLTIDEGKEICKVVDETGKVFQVGTQQRSEHDLLFLKAIAIVHSGRLGKNVKASVAIGDSPVDGPFESTQAPADLDWNMWVGPAPSVDYSEERRKFFRWYFEYSGGKMTDWGAHHIDISQWALDKADTGPVVVKGTGKMPPLVPNDLDWVAFLNGETTLPNGYNTPSEFELEIEYDDGTVMLVTNEVDREDGVKFGNGILFEGDQGRIFVNRGKLTGAPVESLSEAEEKDLHEQIVELYKGKQPGSHMGNFYECVEDRSVPISDVNTHHRTMTVCHLCNIALMLGRELKWDPKAEHCVGDDEANQLMSRKSRALPAVS